MAEFQRLGIRKFPKIAKRQTSDTRYWKKLSFPIIVKEYGAVSHVDFCRTKPHDFVATSSSRIQIYSSSTHQVNKSFSKIKDKVYCGSFRNDGKLMIAGGENGSVKLFDVNTRAVLREFKETHRVTKFLLDNLHAMSGSDDKCVMCWDIATGQNLTTFKEHEDYVRCGVASQTSKDIFITGAYDHCLKVWDMRSQGSVLSMDHGSPVECVQIFPTGGICISAGSNIIKVWDILGGGRLLAGFSNHQKTITSICFDGEHRRLLSGSLDRHVKIYDIQDYTVVHSMDYPSPILSLAVSPDDTHVVTGMSNGFLSIKYRLKQDEQDEVPTVKKLTAGTYHYFVRGKNSQPQQDDFVVSAARKHKLKEHDQLLKKFEYSKALDSVLTKSPYGRAPLLASVLQELIRRKGLWRALAGRDEEGLVPILEFLIRYINNPRYTALITDVANAVLDIYGSVFGQSEKVDRLFTKLRNKIGVEIHLQQKAFELLVGKNKQVKLTNCTWKSHPTEAQVQAKDRASETVKEQRTFALRTVQATDDGD
ncbi:snoRNA-binding rRNA-processing protein [Desmophyllum pertusum]|uniref:U3 small nucleolar RNA-associated protein 15 homolog n=1 Tax=Desmophyllum pertusum TaxID=174260 RepID=A0A9W9YSY5_9CNID|nr:snoRNA-binding rRNA-processing protein [Desmophyllum pertusum]